MHKQRKNVCRNGRGGVQKGAEQINQTIITDDESDLSEEYLETARRISAVHLPWNKTHKPWIQAKTPYMNEKRKQVTNKNNL